jgi:hypothetical protein
MQSYALRTSEFVMHTRSSFLLLHVPATSIAGSHVYADNGLNHVATNVRDGVTMVESVFESPMGPQRLRQVGVTQ